MKTLFLILTLAFISNSMYACVTYNKNDGTYTVDTNGYIEK